MKRLKRHKWFDQNDDNEYIFRAAKDNLRTAEIEDDFNPELLKVFMGIVNVGRHNKGKKFDTFVKNISGEDKKKLRQAYFKDFSNLDANKYPNRINNNLTAMNIGAEDSLEIAFLFGENLLEITIPNYIESKFARIYFKQLVNELSLIERKVLDDAYEFRSESFINVLSNIRLSNRSQSRARKNMSLYEDSIYPENITQRRWHFGNHGFSIGRQLLVHKISGNRSRQDWIDRAGSYAEVYNVLEAHKTDFNEIKPDFVSDSIIATWIKQIVLNKTLSSITDRSVNKLFNERTISRLKKIL